MKSNNLDLEQITNNLEIILDLPSDDNKLIDLVDLSRKIYTGYSQFFENNKLLQKLELSLPSTISEKVEKQEEISEINSANNFIVTKLDEFNKRLNIVYGLVNFDSKFFSYFDEKEKYFINSFIKKDEFKEQKQKYLILGSPGVGKTTLINRLKKEYQVNILDELYHSSNNESFEIKKKKVKDYNDVAPLYSSSYYYNLKDSFKFNNVFFMHIPEELQKKNIFNRLSFNQSKGVSDKKDQFLSKYFDELRKPMCILFGNYVVNSDFIILKKDATYTDYELFTDFNSDVHDYYAI